MSVSEALRSAGPCFSFEFFPPKTRAGRERLYRTIEHLAELNPSFVSVTYGAGGSSKTRSLKTVEHIEGVIGLPTVAHLTCRTHTRDEIAAILDELHGAGVQTIMALRGDAVEGQPDSGAFGYATDLIAAIREDGRFAIGAATYPEAHPESDSIEHEAEVARIKQDRGASFLVTQLFFESKRYADFRERTQAAGVDVPIVPGIMPVTNVGQLERFTRMCGASIPAELAARLDAVRQDEQAVMAVGIEWAIRQCRALLADGAPGVHFYTLNQSLATRVICTALQGI